MYTSTIVHVKDLLVMRVSYLKLHRLFAHEGFVDT